MSISSFAGEKEREIERDENSAVLQTITPQIFRSTYGQFEEDHFPRSVCSVLHSPSKSNCFRQRHWPIEVCRDRVFEDFSASCFSFRFIRSHSLSNQSISLDRRLAATSDWDQIVYIPSDGNSSGHWSNPESNLDSTSTELVVIKSLLNGMVINYEPQDNLLIRYKVEKGWSIYCANDARAALWR